MTYHLWYNVNKDLNMIQRKFYLYPDIFPNYIRLSKNRELSKNNDSNYLVEFETSYLKIKSLPSYTLVNKKIQILFHSALSLWDLLR